MTGLWRAGHQGVTARSAQRACFLSGGARTAEVTLRGMVALKSSVCRSGRICPMMDRTCRSDPQELSIDLLDVRSSSQPLQLRVHDPSALGRARCNEHFRDGAPLRTDFAAQRVCTISGPLRRLYEIPQIGFQPCNRNLLVFNMRPT